MQKRVVLHGDAPAFPMLGTDAELLLDGLETYANHHHSQSTTHYQLSESPTTPDHLSDTYRQTARKHEDISNAARAVKHALEVEFDAESSDEDGFVHVSVRDIYADMEVVRDILVSLEADICRSVGEPIPNRDNDSIYDIIHNIADHADDHDIQWELVV